MNVLLLGNKAVLLRDNLEKSGHIVVHKDDRLLVEDIIATDFIVSFGYKFILSREIVMMFRHKIVNENTPKGVTFHEIDENIDTGNILLQKSVTFDDKKKFYTCLLNLITMPPFLGLQVSIG